MKKRYIITGCASGGKTTLINSLRNEGFHCHEEVSRKIIREQLLSEGLSLPWINLTEFSELVFVKMKHELEKEVKEEICFYDRGIPDIIAYLSRQNLPIPDKYYQAIKNSSYNNTVFLAPPWDNIFINDNERPESFQEAVKIYKAICNTYQSLGFNLQSIPLLPVKERMSFVLKTITSQNLTPINNRK